MITNNPTTVGDTRIDELRAAIEHRASWFYLMIDEAKKRGLDSSFARNAIFRCGCFHSDARFPRTDDLAVFSKAFLSDTVLKIFDMDVKENSHDRLSVEFHYCPLVTAWLKLGVHGEDISELCDIAMDGDRGIVSRYGNFSMELGGTIAGGAPACQITISREDSSNRSDTL
jgi:hypothetical protein